MARTRAILGAGARLSDYLSASLLARVYPAPLVNEVLDDYGCNSQRVRLFPATAGVYYCMALSLYPEASYESVFAAVVDARRKRGQVHLPEEGGLPLGLTLAARCVSASTCARKRSLPSARCCWVCARSASVSSCDTDWSNNAR